jgi:hypothetical protein
MDRNLGASRRATSVSDNLAFGDLYQNRRRSDGHQCRNSGTTNTLSSVDQPSHGLFIIGGSDWRNPANDLLWQPAGGNNPCPTGYRIPSAFELLNESNSWQSPVMSAAFNSPLKWVAAGMRDALSQPVGGIIISDGQRIAVWSYSVQNQFLDVDSAPPLAGSNSINGANRSTGISVRCIRN